MYKIKIEAELTIKLPGAPQRTPLFWKDIIEKGCADQGYYPIANVKHIDIKEIPDPLDELPEVIYAVPWIEVEFGQRNVADYLPFQNLYIFQDEGHRLFTDLEFCKESTLASSKNGAGGGSYYGPEWPLHCVEVPTAFLEKELQDKLKEQGGRAVTKNNWSPRFTGKTISIKQYG